MSCGEQRIPSAAIPEKRGNEKSDIPIPIYTNKMGNLTTNNERGPLPMSGEFRSISFCFTAEALEWLSGATSDDGNNPVANRNLFYDLLQRMRFTAGRDESFRRPQRVQAGAFQFSEIGLAAEWNMGRKRIHNLLLTMERVGLIAVHLSRVASVAAMTCVTGWTDKCGDFVSNPYSRSDRLDHFAYSGLSAPCIPLL